MKRSIQTLSIFMLAISSVTAAACSDDVRRGGSSGDGSGSSSGGSGTTTSSGSGSGSTGSGSMMGIDWSGTWSVDVAYSITCDTTGFGNFKDADWTQTDTLEIAANGGGLEVSFPSNVNYQLTGTGNDMGMTLSGQYPAKDEGGGAADIGEMANTVTIKVDSIFDANSADGSISGQYKGQFGQDCTIKSGTVAFSR